MKRKEEEPKKRAVAVVRQLARPMSKEELAIVSGAGTTPCQAGLGGGWSSGETDNID
jgi:hypothetical protein